MAGFFSRHNNAILCNVAASAGNYRNASFAVSGFFSRHSKAILCTVGASVGLYFIYRYYIAKKQQIRSRAEALAGLEYRRRRVEKLVELRDKLEQLLGSLDNFEPEPPETEDDECIVCNSAKAIIQTYPCKHRVLCRRCFVKTLQVAVNDLNLPLKCVVCRTRIQTLDRERHDVHLLTPPDTQQQPAQETQC